MKRITLLLFAFGCSFASMAQTNNYQVGDIVNDFTVTDTEGVIHNLYDITASGKYVFLDFFFDTCVPCQQTQTYYNELHDKYGCNEDEIFVISINNGTDNNAEVIAFENTYGGPWVHAPAVSNEGNSEAVTIDFGVSAFPTYCLISPNNEMVNRDIWPISDVSTFEAAFPTGLNPTPMPCTILGIDDATADNSISLFPNPSNGSIINLKLNKGTTSADVRIYSVTGALVYEKSFESNLIQINTNLVSGIYVVKVNTNLGTVNKNLIVK